MSDQADETQYPVYWKGHLVGLISELGQPDMWYFDAEWHPTDTLETGEFAEAISHLVGRVFFSATEEQLVWVEIPALKLDCTIVHVPIDNRITFRRMFKMKPPKSYVNAQKN